MRDSEKWVDFLRESLLNKPFGFYDEGDEIVLSELFFMLCLEVFERDEDGALCGEEYKIKSYIAVLEDFIAFSDLQKFRQIVSDMYKDRNGEADALQVE